MPWAYFSCQPRDTVRSICRHPISEVSPNRTNFLSGRSLINSCSCLMFIFTMHLMSS